MGKTIEPSHTCMSCDFHELGTFCGFLIEGCTKQVKKPWAVRNNENNYFVGKNGTFYGHNCRKWSGDKAYKLLNESNHD